MSASHGDIYFTGTRRKALSTRSDNALLVVALLQVRLTLVLSKVIPLWACVHMRFSMCRDSSASHLVDIEIR